MTTNEFWFSVRAASIWALALSIGRCDMVDALVMFSVADGIRLLMEGENDDG